MDKYANYNELKQHERQGEDYVILLREGNSRIALIAPHGGGIEPGTVDIADAAAGSEHAFYAFKGIKKEGNAALHITSDSRVGRVEQSETRRNDPNQRIRRGNHAAHPRVIR